MGIPPRLDEQAAGWEEGPLTQGCGPAAPFLSASLASSLSGLFGELSSLLIYGHSSAVFICRGSLLSFEVSVA